MSRAIIVLVIFGASMVSSFMGVLAYLMFFTGCKRHKNNRKCDADDKCKWDTYGSPATCINIDDTATINPNANDDLDSTTPDDSFTVPTDESSLNECYGSRYGDLRAAFGTDKDSLGAHWTSNGESENRTRSCTLTDEEATCYATRYSDIDVADLQKVRKHYYETGMSENRDFTCGLGVKELKCYVERYPDLQTAFGTDYDARSTESTLYKALVHWNSHGKSEERDATCD
jgi:hypothetical protein